MSQTKVKLAPFRADHVGSFLRPQRLKDARKQYAEGKISAEELKKVEDEEILKLIEKEKEAGLKSITDGEFRRGWWHFDFMANLSGAEMAEGEPYHFEGVTTKPLIVKIKDKIRYNPEHPFFEHFEFLNKHIGEGFTAKQTIPSPNMFFNPKIRKTQVYSSIQELADDLAEAYRKTIQHFYDLGCRYLQLDDVYWANLVDSQQRENLLKEGINPDDLAEICKNLLNSILENKPEDMLITMHVCRGNFHSAWIYSGGYDVIADALFGVNVDGFFLEYDDERSGGFAPLAKSHNQNIVLGVITSKVGNLEDPELIKKRISEAAEYVPLDHLFLSPQCGFSSTEEGNKLADEQQWQKVKNMISIANEIWPE